MNRKNKQTSMVTGNFGVDDVVQRNRYATIAAVCLVIVLFAAVIPFAVYRSLASTPHLAFEPEGGNISNNIILGGDPQASANNYAQFGTSSAVISLTPSTASVAHNGSFSVTVRVNTSKSIVASQANVTYNAAQLSLQSIDYTGSPLNTDSPDAATTSGSITLSRYTSNTPPVGSFVLAKLNFASVSTGSSPINVSLTNSSVYDNTASGLNILSSVTGTTVTLL